MRFKNNTDEKIRIRFTLKNGMHYFKSIRPEEIIELENKMEGQALRVGLEKTIEAPKEEPKEEVKAEESKIGKKKVETKKRK